MTTVTVDEVLDQLEALGNEKVRAQNARAGAGEDQFGVALGEIRAVAKRIRTNHALALSLWDTGNVEAQFLATLRTDLDRHHGRPAGVKGRAGSTAQR